MLNKKSGMFTEQDEKFMKLALGLAKKARARTKSNPMVGAVIVKNGKIIGKGYHREYGGAHAEVEAFNSAKDVRGATMYVTLEPCCHYGKTPPCSERVIKEGIARVVIASLDPNPLVAGKGVEQMRNAGIRVDIGLLDEKQQRMNEKYLYYIKNKMPFILLKSAVTLDGKIATKDGKSKWITSEKSRQFTRKLRGEYQAIMVGINTVIADNPMLTTRIKGETDPIKIIVDSKLRIPMDSNIVKNGKVEPFIILTDIEADMHKCAKLEKCGAQIVKLPSKDGKPDLVLGMDKLAEQGISSILLEGGGTLNFEMLRNGLVNKCMFVIAPKILGGSNAKTSVEGTGFSQIPDAVKLKNSSIKKIDSDIAIIAYVDKGR